ncbi:hypothetical protein CLIM01_14213 [Colletotrichum limetticola]|uniref:Uncharacterized protein n=1 Tax=Colletotrichum limetticola TaxID=1209924 RepID=A0ABQ9P9S9_9PEZI|nr:hypothetical protein CLIM01_14213 [Colletotrichum limetticola]
MVFDAVFDYDVCHSSQDHQDSPSIGAHSRQTASPIEVVQASFQESEIPACKPHDGQALDDTSSASTHVGSEATKAVFSSDAEVLSTSPSLRRFRHKFSQMHKTMRYEDGDAGSEDPGNEDGLDRLGSRHNEENSSSPPDVEDSGSKGDDSDDVHQGRKRRKISTSTSCSVRRTAANSGLSQKTIGNTYRAVT